MHEAQDAIAAVRAAGQTPVLVIIPDTCGCGAAWRAAFNADRCVTSTAAFRNGVERYHFAVRTRARPWQMCRRRIALLHTAPSTQSSTVAVILFAGCS